MLEFDWDNLDEAIEDLIKQEITPVVRGLAVFTWNSILTKTPQYHGRLVASWSFSLNSPQFLDRSNSVHPLGDNFVGPVQAKYRGHHEAIVVANMANAGRDLPFQLGDTIWFANGADHGEGAYSSFIENVDESWLRQYNRPGHAVERSLAVVSARFGDDITKQMANQFKNLRIG